MSNKLGGNTMEKKKLRALFTDFKYYAMILLAVSVFLYIGVVLPNEGTSEWRDITLMVSTLIFLAASFTCFKVSLKYKKQYEKLEE